MTKLTFDVDFNKDPEEILKEIQERARLKLPSVNLRLNTHPFFLNFMKK